MSDILATILEFDEICRKHYVTASNIIMIKNGVGNKKLEKKNVEK